MTVAAAAAATVVVSLTLPLIFMTQHDGWTDGIAEERAMEENMG